MALPLLTLNAVTLGFGGRPLFRGVDLAIGVGERIALVGRNGSGKSTLLRLLDGVIEPDAGERHLRKGVRVSMLAQEPDLAGHETVLDYAAGSGAEQHEVSALLHGLGVDGSRAPANLSGGEVRRAALARTLAADPDLLLLDEPTNHLDLPAIEWLEERLASGRFALVAVSHDRAFLERVSNTTLWLDRGRLLRLDGGFAHFDSWSQDILEREAIEGSKLDKLIAQETVWSHQGITARRKRNQGRLRRLHKLRAERARRPKAAGSVHMEAASAEPTGRLVIGAEEIAKSYDGNTVIRKFSTRILRGDRVGIIGPNGAGKTTLLRLLIGDLNPDSGRLRLGTNIEMVYLDQTREALEPGETPWSILCPRGGDQVMVGTRPRHVVSYLRDFLFDDRQARSPVESLSGGERNRLLLARALARPSNLLVLDEPTNDLDMDTLDLMQEMLADYGGTILLVSHDRDFLDRVVTSTIALEGDGTATEYPGGYSDYLRQRRAPAAESRPRRKETAGRTRDAAPGNGKPHRLGFREKRALEQLPGRMASLESRITELEAMLADPSLYARDRTAFDRATADLAAARTDYADAEEEWLALELVREELESKRRDPA